MSRARSDGSTVKSMYCSSRPEFSSQQPHQVYNQPPAVTSVLEDLRPSAGLYDSKLTWYRHTHTDTYIEIFLLKKWNQMECTSSHLAKLAGSHQKASNGMLERRETRQQGENCNSSSPTRLTPAWTSRKQGFRRHWSCTENHHVFSVHETPFHFLYLHQFYFLIHNLHWMPHLGFLLL